VDIKEIHELQMKNHESDKKEELEGLAEQLRAE
jgi:hypothetical protein